MNLSIKVFARGTWKGHCTSNLYIPREGGWGGLISNKREINDAILDADGAVAKRNNRWKLNKLL